MKELGKMRYRKQDHFFLIDIFVKNDQQLFDLRDPSPFREKDLDSKAVEYITGAVEEIGLKAPIKLVIHYEQKNIDDVSLQTAIQSYFCYEVDLLRKQIISTFKLGRFFLIIGFISLCLLLALAKIVTDSSLPFRFVVKEGLMIMGWVCLWRPLETFLYDWWPLLHKKKIYEKIAKIDVETQDRTH
ncbi:MAG: hypothetical protein KBD63_00855 [Bacteriovoracaceae bacterium]|nr:hypothetical protein [Bacteriovoracaceae bacterium]